MIPFIAAIAAAVLLCSSCAGSSSPTSAQLPTLPRFSFPANPGTQWTYNYKYQYKYVMTGEVEDRTGKRFWQIISVSSTANATSCVIQCTTQDTIHLWGLFPHPILGTLRDTTYTVHSISSFPVVISSDTIVASWQGTVGIVGADSLALVRFSRPMTNLSDTLKLQQDGKSAFYLSGTGLVKYSAYIVAHHFYLEELTLISASIK
jgi:hypothetical protein